LQHNGVIQLTFLGLGIFMMAGERSKVLEFKELNNRSIVYLFIILIIISSLIIFSLSWFKQKPIKSYEIVGLKYFKKEFIDSILKNQRPENINESNLSKALSNLDFVQNVKIYRTDPEKIVIEVKEKEPIIEIAEKDGIVWLLDSNLNKIENKYAFASFPRFYCSSQFEQKNFPTEIKDIVKIMAQIKRNFPKFYRNISEVQINGEEITFFTNSSRTEVKMMKRNFPENALYVERLLARKDFLPFLKKELDFRFDGFLVVR